MPHVNEHLLALFCSHKVEAILQDGMIVFPGRLLWADAALFNERRQSHGGWSVQLDVRLALPTGQTLIESFAGIGDTAEQAVADALHNFTVNSFHVLLAAFFCPGDPQVNEEEWLLGGQPCRVVLGNAGIRGKPPVAGEELIGWFAAFESNLKEQTWGPGTHWVRLYYAQMQGKALVCEVLRDNEVWEAVQAAMAGFAWPRGDDFYSVRIFLVVHVPGDPADPAVAVGRLVELIAGREDFTPEDVQAALEAAGVPARLANRAYHFTQIAWGRVLLAGLGVNFSPDYVCLNAAGEVVESGALTEEPCFAEATRLAGWSARTPGFRRLTLTAADVHAVNDALNKGSKPENLVAAPAFVFLEAPTAAGLENAERVMAQHLAALPKRPTAEAKPPVATKKPWWQFW